MVKQTKHNPDYIKNKDADVVKHGLGRAVPDKEWCKNIDLTPEGNNSPAGAFLPRKARDRPSCHVKVNECDH